MRFWNLIWFGRCANKLLILCECVSYSHFIFVWINVNVGLRLCVLHFVPTVYLSLTPLMEPLVTVTQTITVHCMWYLVPAEPHLETCGVYFTRCGLSHLGAGLSGWSPGTAAASWTLWQDVSNMSVSTLVFCSHRRDGQTAVEQFAQAGFWLFTRPDARGKVAGGKLSSFMLFAQYKTFMHSWDSYRWASLPSRARFACDSLRMKKQRLRFRTKSSLLSSTDVRRFHRLFFFFRSEV